MKTSWTDFCSAFGFAPDQNEPLRELREEAAAVRPDGLPSFLTPEFCRRYYPLTGCPDRYFPRLEQVLQIAERAPEAVELAWMIHYGTFLRKKRFAFPSFPLPEKLFGDNAGMFQFLTAMSCLPLVERTMERLGIPVSYAHDLAKWFGGAGQIFEAGHHGLPGFDLSQISWLRNSVDGKLFRLGRLEFLLHTPPAWLPAIFRNRKTKSVIALCPDRWRFLPDGLRPRLDTPDSGTVFTRLLFRDGYMEGTPIRPDGSVRPGETLRLDLELWEPACSPWELVPSIHIPGGGGLTPEAVKSSLLTAKQFFLDYFGQDIRLFCCCSWILDPNWEEFLPDSNMVRFRREGYAFPGWEKNGNDGYFFVFGSHTADPFDFPSGNRLFHAFQRLLKAGKTPGTGGVFFLSDRLSDYGTQPFRTPPLTRP